MSETRNPIVSAINQIIAVLKFHPSVLFTLSAPSAFLLFAPKEYVDLILNSPNFSTKLNPWIGLVFLYSGTGFIVYVTTPILKIIFNRLIWWYRRNYDDNY